LLAMKSTKSSTSAIWSAGNARILSIKACLSGASRAILE
jgi:hypothetical protein